MSFLQKTLLNNNLISLNQLLNSLSVSEYKQIAPYFEEVNLKSGQILHQPYDVILFAYFPLTAMISLVSIMENGATTEIGLIGNEGMIGLPIFLGGKYTISQAIVQMSGQSLKIKAEILQQE